MKYIIGLLLILAGVLLGAYLGIWVMFIGGITALITACKAEVVIPLAVALSIARIMFAGVVGWLTFGVCCLLGSLFFKD